ncbi:RICIN domain-containing protein [Streptomyces sp. DSM 44915]|uniref:RICIN domain-containing protein n=1 Tax=Streptomyces chisholmiae TaxID=3075540 RepID=A0ABU2JRR4_9ACTN|nr:RICIN domain-containing protein [Streptomyces sp. DSM 44915]MDT0267675.1 RICIN domain-containing protein [Streptomyces sp. DSM 44915]
MVNKSGDDFPTQYRRGPAKTPRGLLPGRRVYTSLGWGTTAAVAVVLTVVTAGAFLGGGAGTGTGTGNASEQAAQLPTTPDRNTSDSVTEDEGEAPPEDLTEETVQDSTRETDRDSTRDSTERAAVDSADRSTDLGVRAVEPPAPEERDEESVQVREPMALETTPAQSGTPTGERGRRVVSPEPLVDGGTYRVLSGLGTCLDRRYGAKEPGTEVQSFRCNSADAQVFRLHEVADDVWVLRSGLVCLAVAGATPEMGGGVEMATCDASPSQRWAVSGDNGLRQLTAGHSGYCLDIADGRTESGTDVRQWDCNQMPAQQWAFERL